LYAEFFIYMFLSSCAISGWESIPVVEFIDPDFIPQSWIYEFGYRQSVDKQEGWWG
jgi:hypothetical protein